MKKLNIHNLKAKEIKKLHTWLRALIQILYFLFLPSVYTAAFAGVKYIFTQIGAGEAIGLTSFVTVLIVLCAYTILFGRFFCGFACAFGSLGDGIHAFYLWCFKKRKKKPVLLSEKITEKLSYLKYLVLTVIAVLCFAGVYGKAKGTSPWDVFSMLHAGNLHLQGYLPGVILLLLIIVGICFFGQVSIHFWHWKQSPSTLSDPSSGSPIPDGHFFVHPLQPLMQFSLSRCNAKNGSTGSNENTAPIGHRFRQKNLSSRHIPTIIRSSNITPGKYPCK